MRPIYCLLIAIAILIILHISGPQMLLSLRSADGADVNPLDFSDQPQLHAGRLPQPHQDLVPWPALEPDEKPNPDDQQCGPYIVVTTNEGGTFLQFLLRTREGGTRRASVPPENLEIARLPGDHVPDGFVTGIDGAALVGGIRLGEKDYGQATCLKTLVTEETPRSR